MINNPGMSGANDQSTSGKTFMQQQPYHTAVGNCLGKLRSSTGGARGTWHTPELGDVLCVLGTQKVCLNEGLHLILKVGLKLWATPTALWLIPERNVPGEYFVFCGCF